MLPPNLLFLNLSWAGAAGEAVETHDPGRGVYRTQEQCYQGRPSAQFLSSTFFDISVLMPRTQMYSNGLLWIGIHPILFHIQFYSVDGPGSAVVSLRFRIQGFNDQKCYIHILKNTTFKYEKQYIYPWASMKDVQAPREASI